MTKKQNNKKQLQKLPDNEIIFYQSADGGVNVEVMFADENIWLTQKRMAEVFSCSVDNISLHLKNIFKDGELDKKSVIEEYSATANDGKKYKTKFYSLEAIIAVGYRVNLILTSLKNIARFKTGYMNPILIGRLEGC